MKKTFEEFTFPNGAKIRNRLVLAPMTTYASNDDLTLSDEEEVYYHSRAKDLGMVITAATAISRNAQAFENQISIMDETYLNSMTRLAKAITSNNSKAIIQLHHGGRMNQPGLFEGQDVVGPSNIKALRDYTVEPRELTVSEIYEIIDQFKNAVKLSIKAGFDGIELHGANTYLLQQFFSPHSNRRIDDFGGSRDKRFKFIDLLIDEVVKVKNEHTNKEFIIGYRFSPEEIEEPGISMKDTEYLVDKLCEKDIDYLHISLGTYNAKSKREKEDKEMIVKRLSKVIENRLPLIGVGGIETNKEIDESLELGYDLVALGLITLGDVNFVEKLKNNEVISKVIDETSLLPSKLYERLKAWDVSQRGYKIK